MSWVIENDFLRVSFKELGGEITSIQAIDTKIEYLWQGDPTYWSRQAPVLFPFVGRLKNDEYHYKGQTYEMTQHGFARDELFDVVKQDATSISFSLKSNEQTKSVYPFDFELILSYTLEENHLICGYQVSNQGKETMYFSIGGHPAFNVPLNNEGTFADYYLHFSPRKSRLSLPLSGPYVDTLHKTLGQTNTDIALTRELFAKDALVYETLGHNSYSIKSEKTCHSVTVSYDNIPYMGIWSPYPKEAPFVCLEPWYGIADTLGASGDLVEKLGINQLAPHGQFTGDYQITIV